ncbi:MAG: DUF2304 domain-containing protein [Candidatus Omnitrophota bacterium]
MHPKTFALIITFSVLILVIDLIRRQKMTFKYALAWLASSIAVIFFTLQDTWLRTVAQWAGFALPSNFIFFLLLIFVIFFSLLLTIHINEQNSRAESLAQAIARLDYRLRKMEGKESDEKR